MTGTPTVAISMGSGSDRQVMKTAAAMLDRFGVACDLRVLSAPGDPEGTFEHAANAAPPAVAIPVLSDPDLAAALADDRWELAATTVEG